MPACATPVGSKTVAAIKKKTTAWDNSTAETLGANDAFPFVSENHERDPVAIDPESNIGLMFQQHPVADGEDQRETFEVEADYRRYLFQLALAMGLAGTPTEVVAGQVYEHVLNMDPELCTIIATLGMNYVLDISGANTSAYVWANAKPNGFNLSMQQGRIVRFQFPYLLRDLARGQDPSAWTHRYDPQTANQYLMSSHSTLLMNKAGDAALADPTDKKKRFAQVDIQYNGELGGEKIDDSQIDEPIREQAASVKLRAQWSYADAALYNLIVDAYEAKQNNDLANALLKADVSYEEPVAFHLTNKRKLSFLFPSLTVERVSHPVQNRGRIAFSAELHAAGSDGNVNGMAFTAPMQIKAINEFATDPLA